MKSYLETFGLKLQEEKLYLACLELGENPASIIARRAKMNRSTAYVALDDLADRGYLHRGSRAGVMTFWAVDPQDLLLKFEQEEKQMRNKIEDFRGRIPELQALQSTWSQKPKIRLYQGEEMVHRLYRFCMESPDWVGFLDPNVFEDPSLPTSDLEEMFWKIGAHLHHSHKSIRDIFVDGPIARKMKKEYETDSYQIRIFPQEKLFTDMLIFPNQVCMLSYKATGVYLFEIEDEQIVQMQKAMFEGFWSSLTG